MRGIWKPIVVACSLSGCSTTSVCDYSWLEKGWSPIAAEPAGLKREFRGEMLWFTNEAGDFLACPKDTWVIRKGNCGNVYEIHKKQDSGAYEVSAIVCMT